MPNRLAHSTSPYLLQHQDNPVDWWEWSDEAFDEAARRGVPVLLSVGYSACHWCHVMAHESFEDLATAAEMNRMFVNVKVDREERPDVDSIYMEAVQAMTGRGGWPMTVWLTPDRRPFFAGTYFPREPHHGMASFGQVMSAVSGAWTNSRSDVLSQADKLVEAISGDIADGDVPDGATLRKAVSNILSQFDATFGGFGQAPKFPQQPVLEFLLRWRAVDLSVDQPLSTTLQRMADGGIHDHLAGGFSRYSVDRKWLVPHFEKMLYDNAQLARIYLWAGIELDEPRFVDVARKTLDYLIADMRDDGGGFFSAEDADSEGVEGKFYVWSSNEIEQVLGEDAPAAIAYYGVTSAGNFEGENILHLSPDRTVPPNLDEMNRKLLEHRDRRVRPGLDDKVVAAWNGLAIRAFAEAGAALDDSGYLDVARSAAGFIRETMTVDGTLMRSWKDGNHSGPGFLDDYAAVALGMQALYQASGEVEWFREAERLVDALRHFEGPGGRLYTTTSDEGLVKRPRDITDNPLPSGNAMAAEALMTSSLLTGDLDKRDRSVAALASIGELAERYPSMIAHHLAVATSLHLGLRELALVGTERKPMTDVFWSAFRPGVVLAQADGPDDRVPLLDARTAVGGFATAYLCHDYVCDLPTTDPAALAASLAAIAAT
ncbi:MAG: thioredoxin domain-containing protein [Acidimicrobiia bacterium]